MANDKGWHYATAKESRQLREKEDRLKANDKKTGGNSYQKDQDEQQKKFNKTVANQQAKNRTKRRILGGSGGIK